MLGISVWAFVDLLKMSMEGTTEEAYFASKEGVQCLTLVSSSSEKLLSIIRRESGAARGLGEEGELEEVDARPIAPAQWVNPVNNRDSIASAAYVTEAPPAIETIERRQQRKSAAKGMLFRGQDSRGVLLCSRAFLP